MALIGLHDIRLSFGGHPLLDGIALQIEMGERLCLLGRNGEGKSTLMKVIAGLIQADSGSIARQNGLRCAMVDQELPTTVGQETIAQFVGNSVAANAAMDILGLEPAAILAACSGGIKRRSVLARALGQEPDILLLDEPTHHLDIDTIRRLEDYLLTRIKTLVFVTHDRQFAKRIANRIAEIDRGQLASFKATYEQFLERREALAAAEDKLQLEFEKKLAAEEVWVRKGVKARTHRNEGRVRALLAMRMAAKERRQRQGTARMELGSAAPSGDLVADIQNLSFAWPNKQVIKDFSARIMRGDRIGIVGPNGSGKTTLIRLLLGQLAPQEGTVRLGTRLETIYFDQTREQLDPKQSVAWNLAGGDDSVMVNGKSRHINAYLQDFLFSPDRARNPVHILSGGEKNRLLLARLFTRPSNMLILDEPTNDLDVETMDLLEDLLLEYPGTILLVSHDRHFLDNVVTNLLVLDGHGNVEDFVGGYSDWLARNAQAKLATPSPTPTILKAKVDERVQPKGRKLSFKENQELHSLPQLIEAKEARIAEIHSLMSSADFYKQDSQAINILSNELLALEQELPKLYQRWEELEALAN